MAVDRETIKMVAIEASHVISSLNAHLFLKNVLERCRGRPLARTDHEPWYDWPLDFLDYEYERESWRSRLLIEAWFGVFKYRDGRFYHRFLSHNSAAQPDPGLQPSPLHNTMLYP